MAPSGGAVRERRSRRSRRRTVRHLELRTRATRTRSVARPGVRACAARGAAVCAERQRGNAATRTGSLVKTPHPRKDRASKPATPASNRASAAGPPSLYLRGEGPGARATGRGPRGSRRSLANGGRSAVRTSAFAPAHARHSTRASGAKARRRVAHVAHVARRAVCRVPCAGRAKAQRAHRRQRHVEQQLRKPERIGESAARCAVRGARLFGCRGCLRRHHEHVGGDAVARHACGSARRSQCTARVWTGARAGIGWRCANRTVLALLDRPAHVNGRW